MRKTHAETGCVNALLGNSNFLNNKANEKHRSQMFQNKNNFFRTNIRLRLLLNWTSQFSIGVTFKASHSSLRRSANNRCHYHQHFRCNFYTRRFQKHKKYRQLDCIFCTFRICALKSYA